jgi:uncharacterized membrane protein YbaN (DUF454 family)
MFHVEHLYKTIKMRILLIILGTISLGLGIAGIFLPLLPTTPFLLLTAWCYAKSSSRLHRWLLEHKVFGKYIRDYTLHRYIPLRAKIISLILLWGTILYSVFFIVDERLWIQIILLVVAVGVTAHLLRLKTRRKQGCALEIGDSIGERSAYDVVTNRIVPERIEVNAVDCGARNAANVANAADNYIVSEWTKAEIIDRNVC